MADDEYETIDLKPDLINMMNLHTIIYNRNRENTVNLIEGVNPRVANDTSDIQEAFNDIMVSHVTMMNDDANKTIVVNDAKDIPACDNESEYPIFVLKDGDQIICYSRSKFALLICGSKMMTEDNNYGKDINIVPM